MLGRAHSKCDAALRCSYAQYATLHDVWVLMVSCGDVGSHYVGRLTPHHHTCVHAADAFVFWIGSRP